MNLPAVKRPSREVLDRIHSLEAHKGKIAVIEPDSGDYFLADTLVDALLKAKAAYTDKLFYSIRIGSPYAHQHKGGIGRMSVHH